MVDIFEEVEEGLRSDRFQGWLKSYGPWVIGGALVIIGGTAGYQGFQAWTQSQREASSEAFISAIRAAEQDQLAVAAAGFETLAEEGVAGYPALALMQRAAIALEEGDNAAAANYFEQVTRATSEPVIRDLAEIRAVWALWDSLSFADVEISLQSLASDTAPYRFLARETIGAAALRDGQLDRAEDAYQFISFAFDAPEGVRRRAQEALAIIERERALAAPESAVIEEAPVDDVPAEPAPAAGEAAPENNSPDDNSDDQPAGEDGND